MLSRTQLFGSWMNLEEYEELEKKGVPVVVDAAPGFGLMNGGMHYGQDFSGNDHI